MKVIKYNEKKQLLSIRYNTNLVWVYSNIDKETYNKMLFFNEDSDEAVKHILRKKLTVGENKGIRL